METEQKIMNFLTKYPYLSPHAKEVVREYHYASSDASIFSKMLNPFWEFCANSLPKNVAPNTITLIGFMGVLLAFILSVLASPSFDKPISSWILWINALLLFFYQTMDAIDGKHARNIKAGSVLGELFDHGVDAIVTVMMGMIACATLQLGSTYSACIAIFLLCLTSYLIVWEDYVTDTMRFGVFNGPTEAILFAIAVLIITAVVGPTLWTKSILYLIKLNTLCLLAFYAGMATAIYESVSIVLKKIRDSPNTPHLTAVGGVEGAKQSLKPFILNLIGFAIYGLFAPSLIKNHIISFILTYGLTSAFIQTRMIFARACRERLPEWFAIQLPFPLILLNAVWYKFAIVPLHFLYLLYIFACYAHFVYNGIKGLTEVLGIEAFSTRKHQPVKKDLAQKSES
jgi:ethanolaminephosphotransferase